MDGLNLLLVEDDAAFAQALTAELGALNHRVTLAADGRAALQAVDGEAFDAVLLDRMLPGIDGVSVLKRLRDTGKTLPVLILSALGLSADKVDGLEAGADDYVVKPTPAPEIDARLRALLRARGWKGSGDTLRAGDITVSPSQFRARRGEHALDLTKLEFQLLVEFVRNAGAALTRAMLVERVWGYDFEPSTNIVDVQIRLLRRKLTAHGGDDPIATVRGVGYMLRA